MIKPPTTISEFLLQDKKMLVLEALLLLPIPPLWLFDDKILAALPKIENQIFLQMKIDTTLLLLLLSLLFACVGLAGKIRKLRNNIEHRRNLIALWRKMVHDVATQHDNTKENISTATILERHEDYYSLRPHLPHETIRQIARTTTFIAGSTISTSLKFILDDIDRLEKEWRLI